MQKRAADFRRRFRHENACVWLPSHQHRQRADVVLMGVRDQDRVDSPARDRFKIRQRLFARVLRMHSTIEHEVAAADLQVI